ncbi:hypothetical protein D3C72_937190 [compost metagenome]
MELRKRSNAVCGCTVGATVASGAGPTSGEAPAAVTAATGTGWPLRASTTGPWAGVLASVPLSRPVASSAIKDGSPSMDTACRPRAVLGTTAVHAMRAKLLTGTL